MAFFSGWAALSPPFACVVVVVVGAAEWVEKLNRICGRSSGGVAFSINLFGSSNSSVEWANRNL